MCRKRQFRLSASHHRTLRVRSALYSVLLSFGWLAFFSFCYALSISLLLFVYVFVSSSIFSPSLFPAVALSLSLSLPLQCSMICRNALLQAEITRATTCKQQCELNSLQSIAKSCTNQLTPIFDLRPAHLDLHRSCIFRASL